MLLAILIFLVNLVTIYYSFFSNLILVKRELLKRNVPVLHRRMAPYSININYNESWNSLSHELAVTMFKDVFKYSFGYSFNA